MPPSQPFIWRQYWYTSVYLSVSLLCSSYACHSLIWKGFGVRDVTSADGGDTSSLIGVVGGGCSAIGNECCVGGIIGL